MNIKFISYLCLFLHSMFLHAGFATGTMVKVPGGYELIENLQPGDIVYSVMPSGNVCLNKIKRTTNYFLPNGIGIILNDDFIIAAPQQKWYLPQSNAWEKTKHLAKNYALLSGANNIEYIQNIIRFEQEIEFFDIQLDNTHTFCVSSYDIVVHNFPLCFIGFSIAWGAGSAVFEGLYFGICIAGWWLGTKLLRGGDNASDNKKLKFTPFISSPGGSPDPNDDDWKKQNPNGLYVESPKHHPNSRGAIGRSPKNGQTALNRSVLMDEGPSRVAIEDNHFVVLRQTSSRVYHGYIVEEFTNLPRAAQKSLYHAKLVRCITKGKIIK